MEMRRRGGDDVEAAIMQLDADIARVFS